MGSIRTSGEDLCLHEVRAETKKAAAEASREQAKAHAVQTLRSEASTARAGLERQRQRAAHFEAAMAAARDEADSATTRNWTEIQGISIVALQHPRT